MKKMDQEIDWWLETPIVDTVAFVSTTTKTMKCKSHSTKIKQTAGFVKLLPGCTISTDAHTIHSPLDHSGKSFKFVKFDYKESPAETSNPTFLHPPPALILPSLKPLDDSLLDEAIAETNSIIHDDSWQLSNIVLITSLTLIAIAATIISSLIIYNKLL